MAMDVILPAVEAEGSAEAFKDCIRQAILSTFTTICGDPPSCHDDEGDEEPADGLIGIISFMADRPWSLVLGLPRETAISLVPVFAGFEIDFDSADMTDMVGELANIVAGDLVARLEDVGMAAQMSLPSVARGRNLELVMPDSTPLLRMRFRSRQGTMWARVVVARSAASRLSCPHCGR